MGKTLYKTISNTGHIFLFIFFSFSVKAETQYSLALWPLSERLGQKTILSVVNDKHGMLWIGTLGGVTRFDGTNFFEYRPHKSPEGYIESADIVKILETPTGEIFVATKDAGLLEFSEETNSFSSVFSSLTDNEKNQRVSSAFSDKHGNIWLGYESGEVSVFSSLSRSGSRSMLSENSEVSDFTQNESGKIFAATSNGEVYEMGLSATPPKSVTLPDYCKSLFSSLSKVSAINDELFWIGTKGNGLFLLDAKKNSCKQVSLESNFASNSTTANIHHIFYDFDSKLTWVSSDQGLYKIDREFQTVYLSSQNTNLSDNEVTSIAVGDNGVYWVGTYKGLNYLVPTLFEIYDSKLHTTLDSIVGIQGSNKNDLWIATYGGLIYRQFGSKRHFELRELDPNLQLTDNKIMSLHVDSNGIWVGYRSTGLEYLSFADSEEMSFGTKSIPGLSSNSISTILTIASGETLVGTYGGGLNVISLDGNVDSYNVADNRVIMIYQSRDSTIWVGAESGFFEFDFASGKLNEIDFEIAGAADLTKPVIWSMTESDDGDLWLGTMHHGLFRWPFSNRSQRDSSSLLSLLAPPAAFSTIYALEVDSLQNIWYSTNRGLVRFDPASVNTQVFSRLQGLHNTEFDFGVSFKDQNGRLYFGGSRGYIRFDPDEINFTTYSPRIATTRIVFSDSTIQSAEYLSDLQTLQLSHNDYFVKFEFSVLDFLDPEKNQYRYMLEGFDPGWIENGNRNAATYTNLPAGDYVLRVQGANSSGVWNREGISLNLNVLPAPWRTWWAYCAYGVLLSFLFWMGKRAYDGSVVKRRAEEMAVEMYETAERADDQMQEQLELQDDLVKSVYQHNVATLALVSDLISQQNQYLTDDTARETAQSSVNRVGALAVLVECLYFENDGLRADLRKYVDILISRLLKDSPVRPETITTINDVSSAHVPIELASPLAIVIYELLENCVQHAFDEDSPANYIHIKLEADPNSGTQPPGYHLVVQDSGLGVPPNIDLQSLETSGLATVKSMARKLDGNLSLASEQGTVVSLAFPGPAG